MPTSRSAIRITRRAVALSFDADRDRLVVCEFGTLPELRLPDYACVISDRLRFFLRRPRGTVIGFAVDGLSELDVDDERPSLWTGPRFRVPTLGLRSAVVAEVVLRSRAVLADRSTPDVLALARARGLQREGDAAGTEDALRDALAAGGLRAHLLLVGCLCRQGRYREAYDHARVATELTPRDAWAWAWLGRACVEAGEMTEARLALRRAVRLERAGGHVTPARGLLQAIDASEALAERTTDQ